MEYGRRFLKPLRRMNEHLIKFLSMPLMSKFTVVLAAEKGGAG